MEKHSFDDGNKRWVACCECERGGNGNDKDKCSCGWRITEWNKLGCYAGIEIQGEIIPKKKTSKDRAKERYQRYLETDGVFDSFISFCEYDAYRMKQEKLIEV